MLIGALVCAVFVVPSSALAQHPGACAPEIAPYAFLGSNASTGAGAAIRWPLAGPLSIEADMSSRRSAVSPLSVNVGLLFDLPELARVTPYVAGGIGLDQYAFADTTPAGRIVTQAGRVRVGQQIIPVIRQ